MSREPNIDPDLTQHEMKALAMDTDEFQQTMMIEVRRKRVSAWALVVVAAAIVIIALLLLAPRL